MAGQGPTLPQLLARCWLHRYGLGLVDTGHWLQPPSCSRRARASAPGTRGHDLLLPDSSGPGSSGEWRTGTPGTAYMCSVTGLTTSMWWCLCPAWWSCPIPRHRRCLPQPGPVTQGNPGLPRDWTASHSTQSATITAQVAGLHRPAFVTARPCPPVPPLQPTCNVEGRPPMEDTSTRISGPARRLR